MVVSLNYAGRPIIVYLRPSRRQGSPEVLIPANGDTLDPTSVPLDSAAPRARVSRETRLLLTAALVAVVALWVLARLRFPEQPTPNPIPIPSLLSQLSTGPRFANLAGEIADLQGRLAGAWVAVPVLSSASGVAGSRGVPALRVRPDAALVLLAPGDRLEQPDTLTALDGATGLAVVRTAAEPASLPLNAWAPAALDIPRYLMAANGSAGSVSLRPVLIGSLREVTSPAWSGPLWALPDATDVAPGEYLFTTSGDLAGLVVGEPGGRTVVPASVLLADGARLLDRGPGPGVDLRVEVQPLTAVLARATGSAIGVVVAWVAPDGAAAKQLNVGDVIESVAGQPIRELRDWTVALARVSPGHVPLDVRRDGKVIAVAVAVPTEPDPAPVRQPGLGLTLLDLPRVGAVITGVARGTAGEAAGLQQDDVITLAGPTRTPSAAQINRHYAAAAEGDVLLLAVTRNTTHLVVGVVKE